MTNRVAVRLSGLTTIKHLVAATTLAPFFAFIGWTNAFPLLVRVPAFFLAAVTIFGAAKVILRRITRTPAYIINERGLELPGLFKPKTIPWSAVKNAELFDFAPLSRPLGRRNSTAEPAIRLLPRQATFLNPFWILLPANSNVSAEDMLKYIKSRLDHASS
ncbi:hypothetical protein [Oryzomicrobium sp.]|uniref:hypothetical protein n=1 Tax=Oryzomicrobium sp. TaxID=1911578 RepID=UPI002FE099D0